MYPFELYDDNNQIILLQNNRNNNNNKTKSSNYYNNNNKNNRKNDDYAIQASRYSSTLLFYPTTIVDDDGHYILTDKMKMGEKNMLPNNNNNNNNICSPDKNYKDQDKIILLQQKQQLKLEELTPKKRKTTTKIIRTSTTKSSTSSSESLVTNNKWLLFHNNNHNHHMSPKTTMIAAVVESQSDSSTMAATNNTNNNEHTNNDDHCNSNVYNGNNNNDCKQNTSVVPILDDSRWHQIIKRRKKDDDDDGDDDTESSSSPSSSHDTFDIRKIDKNHHNPHLNHHHQKCNRLFHSNQPKKHQEPQRSRIVFFYNKFIFILLFFYYCSSSSTKYVNAIRSIRIMAPDYIFYGDPMWLNCSVVDLDYNQIYSIKWFKDNDEMYRFITSDESPTTFYDTPGIVIDEHRSNYGNLYISRSEFRQEADFRCEVLAENDFNTVIQIKKIKVYYIPRDGQPIIVGKKSHFGPNEPVNLTCTSPMSTPAARLVVNLNGNSLISNNNDKNVQIKTYHRHFENGQSSTSVNVQFPGSWLQAKKINQFECTSSIVHRFNRTASLRLDLKMEQNSSGENDDDNHTVFYSVLEQSNHYSDRLTPRIENYMKKYEIGDQISIRCISAQYKPMPELYWLLDGQPLDAQYLDYKQNDYHINGFVRLDLKYRLSYHNKNLNSPTKMSYNNNNNNNNVSGHRHLYRQRHTQHHNGKRNNNANHFYNNNNNNNNNKVINSIQQYQQQSDLKSTTTTTIDSYHFECVQVLSNVISVSSEVVQLYGTSSLSSNNNHESEQLHHGNSVEAVKSLIGNGSTRPTASSLSIMALKHLYQYVLILIWFRLVLFVSSSTLII